MSWLAGFPGAVKQAEDIAHLVRAVLGSDVVAGYLHGSAVHAGLRPSSDVDILVVTRRRTTASQRRALVDGLLERSAPVGHRAATRPVELTVVVGSDVRPWRYPPRSEFQYGEWLREEFERGECPSPQPDPDLAPLITMVLLADAPLFGPPPAQTLDPVPQRDLTHAIAAGIPDLLAELESDTRNVILTLARVWTTMATGKIRSKDAAADWALEQLPAEHRPVLAHARAAYLGDEEDRWHDKLPAVHLLADHIVTRIDQLR